MFPGRTLLSIFDGCSVSACSVLLLSPLGELVDLAQGLKIHDSWGRWNEMEQKIRTQSQFSNGIEIFSSVNSEKARAGVKRVASGCTEIWV